MGHLEAGCQGKEKGGVTGQRPSFLHGKLDILRWAVKGSKRGGNGAEASRAKENDLIRPIWLHWLS